MKINGLKVQDATRKVILKITAADIKLGDSKDPASCAAAIACRRIEGVTEARVHIGRTYLKLGKRWLRFNTSPAMRSEIIAFDRGGAFEPGSYALNPCPPQLTLSAAGKREVASRRVVTKKGKRRYHTVTGIRSHGANI